MLQYKHNGELEKERAVIGKKDKKIADLIRQLDAKRELSDETVDEEFVKDKSPLSNDNGEKKLETMRHHYEEVITSLKE